MRIQITDAKEYGHEAGFVVEAYRHWNSPEQHWAIPDWEEWGFGGLDQVFPTREAAQSEIEAFGLTA